MTPGKNLLKKIVIIALILFICITMASLPVLAATPHEDPDTAQVVFSGISLFDFYSNTLDFVLMKSPQDVETSALKAPFANIPPNLEVSFPTFLSSATSLSNLIVTVDENTNNIKSLLGESRYSEATPLIKQTFENISSAEISLTDIEYSTEIAGIFFKVSDAKENSSIVLSYTAVLDRIQRLSDSLDLYRSMLKEMGLSEELINGGGLSEEELTAILKVKPLLPTELSLNVKPTEAFVGDTVELEGFLSTNDKPLDNRDIDIVLNGSSYLTVKTDSQGHYDSVLQIPYWYNPILQIQSLYYPRFDDVGIYDSSLSPSITLNVLFFNASMMLQTDKNAYPGRNTTITGQLDYGQYQALDKRKIEVYLDNILVREFEATDKFSEILTLDTQLQPGKHLITISAPASGKYAPVIANTTLKVTKATPVLNLDLPSMALIPGKIIVKGQLNSEVGPVTQADIAINFAQTKVNVISSDDGTFNATLKHSLGFGLFGSQSIDFTVIPQEPWHTTLVTSHKIMTVYTVNCGIFFLILMFLGIFLPRRIRLGKRTMSKSMSVIPGETIRVSEEAVADIILPEQNTEDLSEPKKKLFYWYRIVILLTQKVSGVLFKPNQTLREFAQDAGKTMGAAGKYVLEFTKLVERVLYSPYQVTENDAKNSERLAQNVRESLKK